MEKTYVALYRPIAVRDVQLCKGDVYGPDVAMDDDVWEDCQEAEVYIGVFTGEHASVLQQVAAQEGCREDAIRLVELPVEAQPSKRVLEGDVYRVRTSFGSSWLVETAADRSMKGICEFCAEKAAKGDLITSVTQIFANRTATPRVAVMKRPEYKAAFKSENMEKE